MEEIIKIPKTIYQVQPTSFGIITSCQISWFRCRDFFQNDSQFIESFVYCCINYDRVKNFVRMFELVCGCPEPLIIKKTNQPNVMWIGMGSWWKYRVRRSLLTAVLRAGENFQEDSGKGFVRAINSVPYLKGTYRAVDRFLSGYTAVKIKKNEFGGWQNHFQGRTDKKIESYLVKKKWDCVDSGNEV